MPAFDSPGAPLAERRARRDRLIRMKEDGLTLGQIGEREGLSKERVRQILKHDPGLPGNPAFRGE